MLVKCSETSPDSKTQKKTENKEIKKSIPEKFPKIVFKADQKEKLAEKLKKEPWKSIYLKLKELAAKDYKIPKSDDWDTKEHGHNGEISQANAFIAWFEKDKKAAEKAKVGISYLSDKWENYKAWGINIRMAHPLQHYVAAWDLLQGTGFFSKEEADSLKQKLLSITDKFYKKYVLNNAMRQISMTVAQNNHPIRTAAAIGFVALAFNEETQTKKWLDWAISELDYLLGPKGQYIQEDGGISEGPHYFFFGLTPCISFYIAMENYIDKNRFYLRNCLNRSDKDPWKDHGCIEGQEFKFKNPFRQKLFHNALDWSLSLRLPDGSRAPIADSPQRSPNGTSLLTLFGAPDYMYWDWAENPSDPYGLRGGLDLTLYYLLYGDDSKKDFRPKWTTRFMPKSGYAVFRSGWQKEDLWFLLLGEYGSARKTIHDHVDGTSIMLAAYGESLITDTGYYKPNASKNALTSGAASHNVILIDGLGAPEKGLLDNWGGADSFIENTLMGKKFSWAESRQEYQNTEIIRGVGFVRNKYFVMADRLSSQANKARKYQLRLHAYAGYDLKGMAKIGQYGLEMEKNYAGWLQMIVKK